MQQGTQFNLMDEELAGLAKAMRWVPSDNGRHTSHSTGFRWIDRGVLVGAQRVKLEHVRIGRRIMTSREALSRFFKRIADAHGEYKDAGPTQPIADPAPVRSHTHRERQIQQAAAVLEAAGI